MLFTKLFLGYVLLMSFFITSCGSDERPDANFGSYGQKSKINSQDANGKREEIDIVGEKSSVPSDKPTEKIPVKEESDLPKLPALEENSSSNNNDPVHFSLIFSQSVQACAGCGIWFDSENIAENRPKLVIEYSLGDVNHSLIIQNGLNGQQNGFSISISDNSEHDGKQHSMFVKSAPNSQGLFYADLKEVPRNAKLTKATLFLRLNSLSGLSNTDKASVLQVHQYSIAWNFLTDYRSGQKEELIREITAKDDFVAKGVNKANPIGAFDFTAYVKKSLEARK